jgi:hypothetical protein
LTDDEEKQAFARVTASTSFFALPMALYSALFAPDFFGTRSPQSFPAQQHYRGRLQEREEG